MSLDSRTLLILGGFLCWILAATIEFQAIRPSDRRVLPDAWTLGLLAQGVGLNLISQRGLIPDAWSIALAHAMLLIGLLCYYVALQKVRGVATSTLLVTAMPVGVAIALAIIGFSTEAFPMRVLVIMTAWVFGFGLSVWSAVQLARSEYTAGASLILVSNVVLAGLALAFAFAVAAREVPGVFGGNSAQLAFYAVNNVCIALSTFGYMDIGRVARNRLRNSGTMQPDELTGLYSRVAFMKIGEGELYRARREGYPICVMAIKIDGLDVVKALRGPVFADRVLKRVADIVLREIRIYDAAGRLSAELIGVVMPELTLEAGLEVAERIRTKVANQVFEARDDTRIAISAGLCEAPNSPQYDPQLDPHSDPHDLDRVIAVAEACLDRAFAEGGNRVVSPNTPASKDFVEGTI